MEVRDKILFILTYANKSHIYLFKEFWSLSVTLSLFIYLNWNCIKKYSAKLNLIYLETKFSGNSFRKEFNHMEFSSLNCFFVDVLKPLIYLLLSYLWQKAMRKRVFELTSRIFYFLDYPELLKELTNHKYTRRCVALVNIKLHFLYKQTV